MNKLLNKTKAYIQEEDGAEEIVTVILTVGGLGLAIGLIWFVTNLMSKYSNTESQDNKMGGNPGEGNEFANPFE